MSVNSPVSQPSTLNAQPACLLLLRHAEVEERYQRVFGGRIDMELSPRGHEQAVALAEYLRPRRPEAIYASPMKRVQQTLAPLLANGAPQPIIWPDLREVDFGDWTGLGWNDVLERYRISAFQWLDQLERAAIPNGESAQSFRARVEPCLRHILREHPGRRVAVLCHGGVIRMLLSILLETPLPRLAAFEVDYASVTEIRVRPDQVELQLLNFTPWRNGT